MRNFSLRALYNGNIKSSSIRKHARKPHRHTPLELNLGLNGKNLSFNISFLYFEGWIIHMVNYSLSWRLLRVTEGNLQCSFTPISPRCMGKKLDHLPCVTAIVTFPICQVPQPLMLRVSRDFLRERKGQASQEHESRFIAICRIILYQQKHSNIIRYSNK